MWAKAARQGIHGALTRHVESGVGEGLEAQGYKRIDMKHGALSHLHRLTEFSAREPNTDTDIAQ